MSTPEPTTAALSVPDAMLVTYADGRTDVAENINRPGLVVRMERAYPEADLVGATHVRVEYVYFLVWAALRLDRTGDERPADDLTTWLDTTTDIRDAKPERPANPTATPADEPAEVPLAAVESR